MDGRFDEAERIYSKLHQADPQDKEVLYLLGALCCDLGIFPQAIRFLNQALRFSPNFPEASQQLGIAHKALARQQMEAEQYTQAIDTIRLAQALTPGDVDLYNWQGLAYLQQRAFAIAERPLRDALACDERHVQARNNLGICLYELGRLQEARDCFEQVLAQIPDYDSARVNLANTLRILGDPQSACLHLRRVLNNQPTSAEVLNNLGTALQDNGETEEAHSALQKALALAPQSAEVRWNLALSQLKLGDYKDGWKNFESRWEGCSNLLHAYDKPRGLAWQGQTLHGKRLLLWAEQGFGDTLQFLRFAKNVADLGAIVIVEVQPELAALATSAPGVTQVVARGQTLPAYDLHCPLMSLPGLLSLDTPTGLARGPYLFADATRITYWRNKLSAFSGIKIGLTWTGKSRQQQAELAAIDARRSISLAQCAPLFALPDARFFSLQKDGNIASDASLPLHDYSSEWSDFADTAAFISNLDLVISVDTAVAHLAGALGKPVWMLNRYDSCWRWRNNANESTWYPSLREFRQAQAGNWIPVMTQLAEELRAFLAKENP
jgi:Flp pilus assembly protein TadD